MLNGMVISHYCVNAAATARDQNVSPGPPYLSVIKFWIDVIANETVNINIDGVIVNDNVIANITDNGWFAKSMTRTHVPQDPWCH